MKPLLFSGIEVEGKFKGKKTLFVQDKVEYGDILDGLLFYHEQLYFGAKYKIYSKEPSDISPATIKNFIQDKNLVVTAEISLKHFHLVASIAGLNIVAIIDSFEELFKARLDNFKYSNIQFKYFSDNGVILIPADQVFCTPKSDYDFIKDKVIFEES